MKHGTYSTYVNRGCRCEECRAARRAYQRDVRRRNGRTVTERPEDDVAPLRAELADLLNELFPLGLTDDCPARKRLRQGQAAG